MSETRETVFLFGAGASYGSDTHGTPPLGVNLFDELRRFSPDKWGLISGKEEMRFRVDFEDGMKTVDPHALLPLHKDMAAYFFNFLPLTSNLYIALAQRIAQSSSWSGAACTLNYERLLELSLSFAGVRPFVGQSPPSGLAIELCFPHGCCHLFCDAVKGISNAVSLNGFAVQTNGPISVIGDPLQYQSRILGDAFPPVMSYFEPSKRTTTGHSFIEEQRTRWQQLAANAKTIVIIGLRVRPHDEHIWGPIATTSARVVYCGGPTGATEYEAWAMKLRRGQKDRVLNGYFNNEFSTICSEAGL